MLATAPSCPPGAPVSNGEFSKTLARVLKRPCVFRAPSFAPHLAMGEMAEALPLKGQRVVPTRALRMGY